MTGRRALPGVEELTRLQFDGWACVWCGASLGKGAVSAGRAEGRLGAHDLSIEVYACPLCAPVQASLVSGPEPIREG